jgi:hypothetical protein
MPFADQARRNTYFRNYMRGYRAKRRARRVQDRLAAVQRDRQELVSQMTALIPTANRVYYRPAQPPPEPYDPLRWQLSSGPNRQSPPCLLTFPPEPLLQDGAITTMTKWRK